MNNTNLSKITKLMYSMESKSDDPDTQVGCVITDADGNILLTSANALTAGVHATDDMLARPEKYDWIEHAERNAVFAAAREGVALKGHVMHLPGFPCVECARSIAQAGIAVLHHGSIEGWDEDRYKFRKSRKILEDVNVTLIERDPFLDVNKEQYPSVL